MAKSLRISKIKTDGGTQPRASTKQETVVAYAEAMREGKKFPPVDVFFDGHEYWLADGFHRVEAAGLAHLKSIDANIHQGTRREAVLFSVGANAEHGLQRTNDDKERAVKTLLRDEEWAKWSDREIATRCGVSQPYVGKLRRELSDNGYQIAARTVRRGGTEYQMDTTSIAAAHQRVLKQGDTVKTPDGTGRVARVLDRKGIGGITTYDVRLSGGRYQSGYKREQLEYVPTPPEGKPTPPKPAEPDPEALWEAYQAYLRWRQDAPGIHVIRYSSNLDVVLGWPDVLRTKYHLSSGEFTIKGWHELEHLGARAVQLKPEMTNHIHRSGDTCYTVLLWELSPEMQIIARAAASFWMTIHEAPRPTVHHRDAHEQPNDDPADDFVDDVPTLDVESDTPSIDPDEEVLPGVTRQDAMHNTLPISANGNGSGFNYKRDVKTSRPEDTDEAKGYDACQTPAYAIDPLLPYLASNCKIWEPACGEGLLVEGFYDSGLEVVSSDILTGENFFEYEPVEWDVLITNPPYSIKFKWLERCYQLGKPFALLLPLETLGAVTAQKMMQQYGFQIMFLAQRVDFKMPNAGWEGGGSQFPVMWFCWKLLPEQVMFGTLDNKRDFVDRMKLLAVANE